MRKLILVMLLLERAYACDTPEKIGQALGHCPYTCREICDLDVNCVGIMFPRCEQREDPITGYLCPWKCESTCDDSNSTTTVNLDDCSI